jgi:hypothetical protein
MRSEPRRLAVRWGTKNPLKWGFRPLVAAKNALKRRFGENLVGEVV